MAPNTLLLTLGDPNGLGPELVCRHFGDGASLSHRLVLIGPESALSLHADRLGTTPFWKILPEPQAVADQPPGIYFFCPPPLAGFAPEPGRPTPGGGFAAGTSLEAAMAALSTGSADGLVTAPLNKAMLKAAGFDFPGHTEFLAVRSGLASDEVCMHLCGWGEDPCLRVSLVTTHPPLRRVPDMITRERVLRAIRLTCGLTADLGLSAPVAVCGLNPHAGESGTIGREEVEVVGPAVEEAKGAGLPVEGPFPADTVFRQAWQGRFSAVVAMYHDQGLAPLKLVHFGRAVNVTLGLPFVRTSVDHGTGYDLVGRDTADTGSLAAALDMAQVLVGKRGGMPR